VQLRGKDLDSFTESRKLKPTVQTAVNVDRLSRIDWLPNFAKRGGQMAVAVPKRSVSDAMHGFDSRYFRADDIILVVAFAARSHTEALLC
jgi:hypothetical protein